MTKKRKKHEKGWLKAGRANVTLLSEHGQRFMSFLGVVTIERARTITVNVGHRQLTLEKALATVVWL